MPYLSPGALSTLSAIVRTNGGGVPRGQIVEEQFRALRRRSLIERKPQMAGGYLAGHGVTRDTLYIHTRKGLELIRKMSA